jgi:hypothetical protein
LFKADFFLFFVSWGQFVQVEMVMVVGAIGGGDGSQFILISLFNPLIVSLMILLLFIISMGPIVHHLFLLM